MNDSTISWCVRGQFSLPFRITVLPQASGVAIARTPRMMGAFHGAMPSTTPAGCRTPMASEPGTSDGITSPAMCVVSAAASRIIPAASITLKPAHMPVAPVSAATASTTHGDGPSIAAHVDHLRYGLSLLNRWGDGVPPPWPDMDWSLSWRKTVVSDAVWRTLRDELRREAERWAEAAV